MKPTIEFQPSPNFKAGPRTITAIVVHYTSSLQLETALAWFLDPVSRLSAHYLIGRDGRVVQLVKDEDIAWHAGRSSMGPHLKPPKEPNVNVFSLGIELVGTADSGFTDRQLASLYSLLEVLVVKYRIPPDRVVGHLHIAPGRRLDPDGYTQQFPWAKVRHVAQVAYDAVAKRPSA